MKPIALALTVIATLWCCGVGAAADPVRVAELDWSLRRAGATQSSVTLPLTIDNATAGNYSRKLWDLCVSAKGAVPVNGGEILHLTVQARTLLSDDESQRGKMRIRVGFLEQQDGAGHVRQRGLYRRTIPFPTDRSVRFTMPMTIPADAEGTGVFVDLECGSVRQRILLESATIAIHPAGTDVSTLERYRYTWPGREADAPWRMEAQERIQRIRQGVLSLSVTEADGTAIPQVDVRCAMQRHAFAFGTMVPYRHLFGTPGKGRGDAVAPKDPEWVAGYHHALAENFNCAVNGLVLKWRQRGRFSPDQTKRYFSALKALGMQTRGHTLLWPKWRFIPPKVRKLENDPQALRAAIEDWVRSTVERYGPLIDEWDVLNEPVTRTDIQDILGDQILIDVFRWAHEADPSARLYVNNFGTLTGVYNSKMADGYATVIERLIDGGAPLGGIGLQGHLAGDVTPPGELLATFDRFATYGLPIRVTEYTHHSFNDDEVRDYLRDIMTAAYSHPAVDGFIFWGFVDDVKARKGLYDRDWGRTEAGAVYRDLVFKQWWTDTTLQTDAAGTAAVRGYHGDYLLTVSTRDGRRRTATASIDAHGGHLTIQMPGK